MSSLIPDQRGDDESEPAPDDATGMMLDLHTTGGMVLWPWSHLPTPPPNAAGLAAIGRKLASYNGYTAGQTYQTLYPSSGSSKDWGYGELGIPAYTIEMDSGTFLAPYSTVDGRVWPQMRDALLYAAKIVRTPYLTVQGPDALGVQAVVDGKYLYVLATIDEQRTGRQTVAGAEFYLDTPPLVEGAEAIPVYAGNGTFDSVVEDTFGYASTEGLTPGRHIVYVRGQDDQGNWGPVSAAFFDVGEPSPGPGGGDLVRSLVRDGVGESGFPKTLAAQPAAIAPAASAARLVGVVAAQGEGIIDAQAGALADDLGLAQAKQRRMDPEPAAPLDGGLRGQVGEPLELGQELGAAVGVA